MFFMLLRCKYIVLFHTLHVCTPVNLGQIVYHTYYILTSVCILCSVGIFLPKFCKTHFIKLVLNTDFLVRCILIFIFTKLNVIRFITIIQLTCIGFLISDKQTELKYKYVLIELFSADCFPVFINILQVFMRKKLNLFE